MVILALLILGLCIGSFVNAFVWRLYMQEELAEQARLQREEGTKPKKTKDGQPGIKELSISKGRSMCTHCHHQLSAKDLIPVLSYLSLRGKCRYCGKKIEDSPLAELLTPTLFILSYLAWPYEFDGRGLFLFGFWLIFLAGFVALTLFDLRWHWLPFKVVKPLIALAIVQTVVLAVLSGNYLSVLINAVLAVAIGAGIFYALYRISKELIGDGDILLGVVLGLLAAKPQHAFLVIFLASLLGTLVALPLLVTKKAGRKSHLPFGPFLMAAAVIVVLFGERILHWYTSQFILY